MKIPQNERLLIISNNVLSTTNNNGKTILSYIDSIPRGQVRQLYFSEEQPHIGGYRYFKLSDRDVLKGRFRPSRRGGEPEVQPDTDRSNTGNSGGTRNHSPLARLLREVIWIGGWKSPRLTAWLDDYRPTSIFFVGGDCCFAYRISLWIAKRYGARLGMYITDDYLFPRKNASWIQNLRQKTIIRHFEKCLEKADVFFTISEKMRTAYRQRFGRDSLVVMNMTESMKDACQRTDADELTMIYAGSLYYGRDRVLGDISEAVEKINAAMGSRLRLEIYSNVEPDEKIRGTMIKGPGTVYGGSLDPQQLRTALNRADIPVFAESFEPEQIEKTMYSLSTKIPEYLSLEKPVFAVGPGTVGSMEYLEDCAMCVLDPQQIEEKLRELTGDEKLRKRLGQQALSKFASNHNKQTQQRRMLEALFGGGFDEDITD